MKGIILPEDVEVQVATVQLHYVMVNGRRMAFENEDKARLAGCPHNKCNCDNLKPKDNDLCLSCSLQRQHNAYMQKPTVEWDNGETPFYDDTSERFFNCIEDFDDYLDDRSLNIDDLMLYPTKPVGVPLSYSRDIDFAELELPDDYDSIYDIIPEHSSIWTMVDKCNEALINLRAELNDVILYYIPDYSKRLIITKD